MNTSTFRAAFPRQLRFWAFHGVMNALPTLWITLILLNLRQSSVAVMAMLSAIATFILLFATLTSLRGPLSTEGHLLSRSLKLGAKIRAWMAVVSLLPLWAGLYLIPDYYCYRLAVTAACYTTIPGFSMTGYHAYNIAELPSSLIYATTIFMGLILSFLLLTISFFALIYLQARDRKRVFAVADPL